MTIAAAPPPAPDTAAYEAPLPPASPPAPVLVPVHDAPHWLLAGVEEDDGAGAEAHIRRGID